MPRVCSLRLLRRQPATTTDKHPRPQLPSSSTKAHILFSSIALDYRNYIYIIIMKVLASALLIGGCAASSPVQQVLQAPHHAPESSPDSWLKPLQNLEESLKSLTKEARAVWDEVTMMYPRAMDQTSFFSLPKKHSRRPDSHWDHITKGADIQSVWVENENGEQERDIDGKLEAFNLRTKKVDPGSLGVDPGVKQYSGYLDDNENDKHLFYCECEASLAA